MRILFSSDADFYSFFLPLLKNPDVMERSQRKCRTAKIKVTEEQLQNAISCIKKNKNLYLYLLVYSYKNILEIPIRENMYSGYRFRKGYGQMKDEVRERYNLPLIYIVLNTYYIFKNANLPSKTEVQTWLESKLSKLITKLII